MTRLFLIVVVIGAVALVGCNKKQDEAEALQKEATGQNAEAVLDSLNASDTAQQPTPTTAAAEPAQPAKKEAPPPEPDYSQIPGFVVQLGSYRDYELATYWADKYQKRDFPAFLSQVDLDGETYYRLRVGIYDTYQEAKEAGDLLADRYSAQYWIDNNR